MRAVPPALDTALRQSAVHSAWCVRVTRRDGVAFGLTSHDRDLRLDHFDYRAAPSLVLSGVSTSNRLNVDTVDVTSVFDDLLFLGADLDAGRFDGARLTVWLVDWTQPDAGAVLVAEGHLGDVAIRDGRYTAELRSLTQALQAEVGDVYTPECRAELGDARCGVSLARFTRMTRIAAVTGPRDLVIEDASLPDDWLAHGRMRWIDGANGGLDVAVARSQGATIALRETPRFAVAIGDRVEVRAGCDKWFASCRDKFANSRNFRGEPFVPGVDAMLRYPSV